MRVFDEEPKDWLDLQNKVAYILSSCDYIVETPKKIKTIRGMVEIDVYAKSSDSLICCECKNWNRNVSQDTVFSFRTIVNDIGANKGIIIAKRGFQSGSYKACQNTNIILKTWNGFLQEWQERFLKSQVKKLLKIKSKLFRMASLKSEYSKYYDALDEYQRKHVNKMSYLLLEHVLQITEMCLMLQYEDDGEIGWNNERIDNCIKNTGTKFNQKFLSYYDFFWYMNKQFSNLSSEIENIYGIKEEKW